MIVRAVGAGLVAIVVVVLGAMQLASSAVYGDLAVPGSLPAALHSDAPALVWLIPGRDARAQAALHLGELNAAQQQIAALPDTAENADLRGRLAEARGDAAAAVAQYVRAGDGVRAQRLIDELATTDPAQALRDQRALVEGITRDASASEITGQAWWRLGQLEAAQAARDAGDRAALGIAAERAYEHALVLAPNEETFLLAAGYQSLANGDLAAAGRWYTRAAEVVPNSADAHAGLGWTAAARGDCTTSRDERARARALRAGSPSGSGSNPLIDALLARCPP